MNTNEESRVDDGRAVVSRRKAVFWSATLGTLNVAFALVRNILLVPLYLLHISLGEYGAWLATGATLVPVVVSDLGGSGALTQRVAEAHGRADSKAIGTTAANGLIFTAVLSVALSLVGLVVVWLLIESLKLDIAKKQVILECCMLAVVGSACGTIAGATNGILKGLQHPYFPGASQLVAEAGSVILLVWMLVGGYGIYALAFSIVAKAVVLLALSLPYSVWCVARASRQQFAPSRDGLTRIQADFYNVAVSTVCLKLLTKVDTVAVGALISPSTAAIYGMTIRAHETVLLLLSQVNSALGPALAHLHGASSRNAFSSFVIRAAPALCAISSVGLGAVVVSNSNFVALWVGPDLYAGHYVSILMALVMLVASNGYTAYDAVLAQGGFKFARQVFVPTALLHVGLIYLFTPYSMLAMLAVMLLTTAIWSCVFWREFIGASRPTAAQLRNTLLQCICIVLLVIVSCIAFARLSIDVSGWTDLVIKTFGYLLMSLLLIFFLVPDLRRWSWEQLAATKRVIR